MAKSDKSADTGSGKDESTTDTASSDDRPFPEKKKRFSRSGRSGTAKSANTKKRGSAVGAGVARSRALLGRVLWWICLVAALFLAIGALLVALHNNVHPTNSIVKFIKSVADHIDGPLSRNNGIFTFHGKHAMVKDAVANWGLAAIVYLVIGRLLQRFVGGKGARA